MKMFDFLEREGVSPGILDQVRAFRAEYPVDGAVQERIPSPAYMYYGKEIWKQALTALLAGENLLLVGPKATGKNVLAENLAAVFGRPEWDISFYLNTDAASLIGTDKNGEVRFRSGPITQCAKEGGFGVLDEINMAKNESLAVLHATLDFRRIIDIPGYERIALSPSTRFIGTMNYGYAGTRELNEALASRFMVLNMPIIEKENLKKLLLSQFPALHPDYAEQLSELFQDVRKKCDSSEISTKALVEHGLSLGQALEMGMVNKSFDPFERQLVDDLISARIRGDLTAEQLFVSGSD